MTESPLPAPPVEAPPVAAPPTPAFGPPMGYGTFQLPPGVELAPTGRRVGAFFLMIPLYIVTLAVGYVIWGAVKWSSGTSPALSLLKMRVVDAETGQPVTWGGMFVRDFLGGIVQALFGVMYIVSFVMFLSGDRHQSIQDKVGKTVVVYDPNGVLG